MTETQPFYFWEQVSMRHFFFHARLCPGIALAGLTLGLPLAVTVQAQTSNLAYEYEDGSFTAEAEINPLAGRLLGRVLKKEIPSAVTFSATELAGVFTLPETTTTVANGSITLDSGPVKAFIEPYIQQAMGRIAQSYSLPEDVGIETLESVLNYRFIGEGLLESDNASTAFTFEYGDDADRLAITGIDPAVLALCEIQQCNTQVDGDFDLKLDVEGFSETSDELGIKLPASVKRALKRAQLFGFKEVAFADGKLTSVVQLLPSLTSSPTEALPVSPETTVPTGVGAEVGAEAPDSETAPASVEADSAAETSTLEGATPDGPNTTPVSPALVNAPATLPLPVQEERPTPEVTDSIEATQAQVQRAQPLYRSTRAAPRLNRITHGNFVFTAERLTAPWSIVFAVPSREGNSQN